MKIIRRSVLLILLLIGAIQICYGQKPDLIVQTGHSNEITSLEFSPKGDLLATSSNSGEDGSATYTIKLWQVSTGKELRTFQGGSITRFNRDGNYLANADGNVVRIFDVETGNLYRKYIPCFTYGIHDVLFSPDNKKIAVRDETEIKIIDLDKVQEEICEEFLTFKGPKSGIADMSFSADNQTLIFIDNSTNVFRWDWREGFARATQKLNYTLKSSSINLMGSKQDFIRHHPTKDIFLISMRNRIERTLLWDTINRKVFPIKTVCNVKGIKFSSNGETFAVFNNEILNIFDTNTQKEISRISFDRKKMPFALLTDGKTIATGMNLFSEGDRFDDLDFDSVKQSCEISPTFYFRAMGNNNPVLIWNLEHRDPVQYLYSNVPATNSLAFDDKGDFLAVGNLNGTVDLWDLKKGVLIKTPIKLYGKIASLALETKLNLIAASNVGREDSVTVWDLNKGKSIEIEKTKSCSLSFVKDKNQLAGLCPGEELRIWNPQDGKIIEKYSLKTQEGKNRASRISSKFLLEDNFSINPEPLELWEDWVQKNLKSVKCAGQLNSRLEKLVSVRGIGTSGPIKGFPNWNDIYIANKKIGAVVLGDGGVKLWNEDNCQEIVTLISLHSNDWLVTTSEGFFDGTSNGWGQLIWRFNNNTFDYGAVELYFNEFFYPNLLQDVLAGNSPQPKAGQELEKIDRRQPSVEIVSVDGKNKAEQISTDKRNVKVVVEVADNAGEKKQPTHNLTSGAQDLRLFRNGSLVKRWDGDVFEVAKSGCEKLPTKVTEPRRVRCEFETALAAGANDLTVYAFNSANVKSNDDAARIEAKFAKRDGTLYVLAVGVNKYANADYNLNYAVKDVVEIGKTFQEQQAKLGNLRQYAKTEIITLIDNAATKENILNALARLANGDKTVLPENASDALKAEFAKIKQTQPEDAVVIYFAGHGVSKGQRFYLLPHNFTGDANLLEKQSVSDLELNQYLEKVDAGKLLMVIDACQSGQALGGKNDGRAPMNSKGFAQLAYDKGMYILTAAQSYQAALEAVKIGDKTIENGLLTYSLLQAFSDKTADKDENKQLWEREWFDFAVNQVPLFQREAMRRREIDLKENNPQTKGRSGIYYLNGDKKENANERSVQTPRVFYRREPEIIPFILSKP